VDLTEAHECVSVSAVCVCIHVCVFTTAMERHCLLIQRASTSTDTSTMLDREDPILSPSLSSLLACLLPFMSYSHSFACPPRTMYRTDLPSVNRATGTHYEP
jgi:hypothetical protein